VVEIDQWIVDFAHLFRDSTGIDFDRHVELHNLGWDKIQEAMDATLRADKALPLLDAAADKFAEVTISGLVQWGHTYTMVARKHLDDAAADGRDVADVRSQVDEQWAKAEAKYNEALGVKGEHVDALQYLASLEMERAKLAAGINVGNRKPEDKPAEEGEGTADKAPAAAKQKTEADLAKEQADAQRELQEWSARAQCAAIDALSPQQAAAGDAHWDKCFDYVKRMVAAVPEEQRKTRPQQDKAAADKAAADKAAAAEKESADKEAAAQEPAAADGDGEAQPAADADAATAPADKGEAAEQAEPQAPEEEFFAYANVLLNWGNFLYERSQLAARAGQEWRPLLDEAVEHFRGAGCAESDIRGALKNHYCSGQLDLGPDPQPEEPEKAAPPAATANGTAAEAATVKGLPSLGPKPKGSSAKKEAAAAN
jgi:chemotaxis protein histidine kinase CheA